MATRDISVVVVTYNSAQWVERCLESVRDYETIVVDHGSTDGTVELVRRRFPEAHVIEEENLGMGGGNNAGMRLASGRYSDRVCSIPTGRFSALRGRFRLSGGSRPSTSSCASWRPGRGC